MIIILQGDFKENFSFVVQDASQNFYCEKSIISDGHMLGPASTELIKSTLDTNKVGWWIDFFIFTDRWAAQYTNETNFMNLLDHE